MAGRVMSLVWLLSDCSAIDIEAGLFLPIMPAWAY